MMAEEVPGGEVSGEDSGEERSGSGDSSVSIFTSSQSENTPSKKTPVLFMYSDCQSKCNIISIYKVQNPV